MFNIAPMKILSIYLLCLYNPPHYCHFIFDIHFFVVYMSNKIFTHSLPMRYAIFQRWLMLWTTPL